MKEVEEKLLKDEKALLPGSEVKWFQFSEPKKEILRTFPNPRPGAVYEVTIETDEVTALCPLTGHPDFYYVKVSYVPGEVCVESKSVKFYFGAFRNYHGFIETIANKVADDFIEVLKPKKLCVYIRMKPRGGIPITVEREYVERLSAEEYSEK